jgi:hypothetical protein
MHLAGRVFETLGLKVTKFLHFSDSKMLMVKVFGFIVLVLALTEGQEIREVIG